MKEGGTLTIIATAWWTPQPHDGVIFEEFKGTGNMESPWTGPLVRRRFSRGGC